MTSSAADPQPSNSASSNYVSSSGPTRRNSSSSYSSDAYAPSIPGFLTLTLHGNCSKCHHHHSSARFKVNLSRSANVTTDLLCQRCNEKWLVIGGRNTTQLSLLSTNSTKPDPVAREVRYSLVDMVRTTTFATLSPNLAGIAESSSHGPYCRHSLRTPSADGGQTGDPPLLAPLDIKHPSQPTGFDAMQAQNPSSLPTSPAVRPFTTQKYGLMTGRRMSHLKESLGMHFPALHRANLRTKFGTLKKTRMSAKQLGKQPVSSPLRGETTPITIQMLDLTVPYERNNEAPVKLEGPSHQIRRPDRKIDPLNAAAAKFLASLEDDSTDLSTLTAKEKTHWVRAQYTAFKKGSVVSNHVNDRISVSTSTSADIAVTVSGEEVNERSRRSVDLLGVGGRQSLSARSYSVRASVITVSDAISEADTVTDQADTVTSGPRSSWIEHFRSERSSSIRPPSLNAYTLQRLRFRRAELRRSVDSAVTVEAIPSTSRPVSSDVDHFSQGSTIRRPTANDADERGSQTSQNSPH